jgi:sortase A
MLTARAQSELRAEIQARIDRPGELPGAPSGPVVPNTVPEVLEGDAVAILLIPRMDLDVVVVEGTTGDALERGPGHYEGTAYPWEDAGTVAIAGHRTTYGKPFWALDRLRPGDRISLITEFGTFDYAVRESREVAPSDMSVLAQTGRPILVLTTCAPIFTASRRLVVFADRIRAA